MSTFQGIRGKAIKSLTSDPSPATAGNIWYNSTSKTLKGVQAVGAWSSGGALTTLRAWSGNAGTQTAALAFGGSPYTVTSEEYNGSSWANGGNLNVSRAPYGAGFGTQTAAVNVGGYSGTAAVNSVEEYNGTSWTSVSAYLGMGSSGILTAAVVFGGAPNNPYPGVTLSKEYDGTNWGTGGALNTGRSQLGAAGTLTAALACGGFPDGPAGAVTNTETYNGSSWANAPVMPTASGGGATFGIQTAAINAGGGTAFYPAADQMATTREYNGSTWAASTATLAQARGGIGSSSNYTSTAGLAVGGRVNPGAYQTITEEYNLADTTKTFTVS